jgi:hypothetical protein
MGSLASSSSLAAGRLLLLLQKGEKGKERERINAGGGNEGMS